MNVLIVLFLPGIITYILMRVTFNLYVGPLLTLVLLIVAIRHWSQSPSILLIGFLSIIMGWVLMVIVLKNKWN